MIVRVVDIATAENASATRVLILRIAANTLMGKMPPMLKLPNLNLQSNQLKRPQGLSLIFRQLQLLPLSPHLMLSLLQLLWQLLMRHAKWESTVCTATVKMGSAFAKRANMLVQSVTSSGAQINAPVMAFANPTASVNVLRGGWAMVVKSPNARMHAMAMEAA